jgi:hypothetical protein
VIKNNGSTNFPIGFIKLTNVRYPPYLTTASVIGPSILIGQL